MVITLFSGLRYTRVRIAEMERFWIKVHPGFVDAVASRGDKEAKRVHEYLKQIPDSHSVTILVGEDASKIHEGVPGPEEVDEIIVCGAFKFSRVGNPQCVNTQALALKLVRGYPKVTISEEGSLKSKT